MHILVGIGIPIAGNYIKDMETIWNPFTCLICMNAACDWLIHVFG